MTRVFTNSQCAHVWAQQGNGTNPTSGRGHGNISFEGPTLFSYGTPIANFVEDKNGETVALIYSGRHSSSTSKHQAYARYAVAGTSFQVNHVGVEGGYSDRTRGENFHLLNARDLLEQYTAAVRKMLRGYSVDRDTLLACHHLLANYVERFGVEGIDLPDLDSDWSRIIAAVALRDTPEALAKRERNAAVRAERKARSEQQKAEEWVAGGRGYLLDRDRDQGALLRLTEGGRTIETSQGARFPVEHGKHAFRLIQRVRVAGQRYDRNGHSIHLGTYAIDWIDEEGNVKAGCHFVKWAEIERLAGLLGLLDKEQAA